MKRGWIVYDREGLERNRWFAERLRSAAFGIGLEAEIVPVEELIYGIADQRPMLFRNAIACVPDFVIMRTIRPSLTIHLETMRIPVFNSARVAMLGNNKRLALSFGYRLGVPVADTIFVSRGEPTPDKVDFPCILKSLDGHGGQQVFWAENMAEAEEARLKIARLSPIGGEYIVQRPVSDLGRDVRVYVIGKQIITSVLRSSDTDFRSNFSLGGKATPYTLTDEQAATAQSIANALDADMVGIDFLFDHGEMVLNEIEDVVGTRMVYSTGSIDMASLFLLHIARQLET